MCGGYCVASGRRRYVDERIRYYGTLRKNGVFRSTEIVCSDYKAIATHVRLDDKTLLYCDPPYCNGSRHASAPSSTSQFTYGTNFDSQQFWDYVRLLSAKGVSVIVSEYEAPSDFVLLAGAPKTQTAGRGKQRRCKLENICTRVELVCAAFHDWKVSAIRLTYILTYAADAVSLAGGESRSVASTRGILCFSYHAKTKREMKRHSHRTAPRPASRPYCSSPRPRWPAATKTSIPPILNPGALVLGTDCPALA